MDLDALKEAVIGGDAKGCTVLTEVADGSVFPTSLGVNPQLSIMGLAHWAAGQIAPQIR